MSRVKDSSQWAVYCDKKNPKWDTIVEYFHYLDRVRKVCKQSYDMQDCIYGVKLYGPMNWLTMPFGPFDIQSRDRVAQPIHTIDEVYDILIKERNTWGDEQTVIKEIKEDTDDFFYIGVEENDLKNLVSKIYQ